jgi:hypothetical protein
MLGHDMIGLVMGLNLPLPATNDTKADSTTHPAPQIYQPAPSVWVQSLSNNLIVLLAGSNARRSEGRGAHVLRAHGDAGAARA